MKKIFILILALSLISFIIMILNIMSLNDIYHDYLSKKVLISENIIENTNSIPEWTDCKNEWNILRIDFIIRIIFMIIVTALIIRLIKDKNKRYYKV